MKDKCEQHRRDPAKEPLGLKFKMVGEKIIKYQNEALSRYDLTFSQFGILLYLLFNCDHGITASELSGAMQIKHPTTVGLLNRLQDKQMITRVTNPDDSRSSFIELTDKSRKFLEENKQYNDELNREMVRGFSEEEIILLRNMLDRVRENVSSI